MNGRSYKMSEKECSVCFESVEDNLYVVDKERELVVGVCCVRRVVERDCGCIVDLKDDREVSSRLCKENMKCVMCDGGINYMSGICWECGYDGSVDEFGYGVVSNE